MENKIDNDYIQVKSWLPFVDTKLSRNIVLCQWWRDGYDNTIDLFWYLLHMKININQWHLGRAFVIGTDTISFYSLPFWLNKCMNLYIYNNRIW